MLMPFPLRFAIRPLLLALFGVSLLSAAANGAAPNTVPPKTTAPINEQLPGSPDAQPERAPVQAARPAAQVTPVAAQIPLKPHSVADRVDLEAFFDGVLSEQIESKRIAGAVAVVVVGDKVVFEKGYGYADVERRRRVDPETTMFRIASVSKLFTWTAVMQLVEQGKLDLNADVNTYLKDFRVPATFEQPVTLKSLLTHTPGFEDSVIGLFGRKAEDVKPLIEVLRQQMPARVRPPGVLGSYSNHGTALAGLVVASVSGMPWEDALERTILQPLGMKNTLVRQPPKDKLPETMSKGYKWEGGRFKEQRFEYVPAAPAGAISTSGADIARFMIAHLNDGRYENARILKPETARQMRERLFTHDPKVDGMCYGFWELHRNGQRVLHHGGDTLLFHTLFALIPEQHVGIFVSYNTDRGATGSDEVLSTFLDRYYPVPDPPEPKPSDKVETMKRFAGEYGATRVSHTTYAKLAALLQAFRISVNDDGSLSTGSGPRMRRYVQVEPLVFQQVDGRDRIVFREDDQGHITHLFFSDVPAIALIRHSGIEDTRLHWGVLVGAMTLFGTALLFWPAIAFSVRGLRSSSIRRTGFSALLSCLGWLLSATCVGFGAGMLIALNDPEQVAFGTPRALKELLLLPQVCVALAAVVVIGSLIAWMKGYWRLSGRLHYTRVALAGVGFCWFLSYWNLLQFGGTLPWMTS